MAAPVSFREKVRVFPLQSGRRPYMCHARKERAEVNGTDQRITSGPAATTAASRGRIHGCTRIVSRKGQSLALATRAASVAVQRGERIRRREWVLADDRVEGLTIDGRASRTETAAPLQGFE